MFINSIFLPKTISDQTMPQGINGKIGDFAHLFSNVFRFVKDETENPLSSQLISLNVESVDKTQNELLNVSLLSDNKLNLEHTNISMIVSAFLSKLKPGENVEELADTNKVKVNEKTPKYFSLSKNEFIKEIKNIIDNLKNGGTKSLENIEISLIANGHSIKINPLATNIVDLENWVSEQLNANSDFEILVKSGKNNLAVEVEPAKNETIKTTQPVSIISVSSDENMESEPISVINKNVINLTTVFKNSDIVLSSLQPQLEGLKQTIVTTNEQVIDQDTATSKSQVSNSILSGIKVQGQMGSELLTGVSFNINSELNKQLENDQTVTKNILIPKNDFTKEFILENQNNLDSKTNTSVKNENILADSNTQNLKKVNLENSIIASAKTLSSKIKVKPNFLESIENIKTGETQKKSSEVNISEISKADKKINIKANQNINSIITNKNNVQEKIALNNLIEKTNVKDIDVNVQKFVKVSNANTVKTQSGQQPEIISIKDNVSKNQNPVLNAEVKKVLSVDQEIKQQVVKKTLETENIKTGIASKKINIEKSIVSKTELSNKDFDTVKAQNNPKLRVQQELFTKKEFVESEQVVSPKIESIKTSTSQQSLKENIVSESGEKIKVDNKNSDSIKITSVNSSKPQVETKINVNLNKDVKPESKLEQKPVEIKSNLQKTFAENELVENKEIVSTKTESIKTPTSQRPLKENIVSESGEKIKVDNKNLDSIKTTSVNSSKPQVDTKININQNKDVNSESKPEQKPVEVKSGSQILENKTEELQNTTTAEEPVKENIKEVINSTAKESFSIKSNLNSVKSENEKTKLNTDNNPEKELKNLKEQTVVEKPRTNLTETPDDKVKSNDNSKNQFENKNVKIDFMQRRVYSQIPTLEIITDESELKNIKNPIVSVDKNKNENFQSIDEPVKSASNDIELKPKNEKQVWVKVSLEKADLDNVTESKKPVAEQNKITIDSNNDGMKKNYHQNNYSEKESPEYQKSKSQTSLVETSQNTEQKPAAQNQTATNQQNLISNLKPDVKSEHIPFKSSLQNEETKYSSRMAEMVEKVKVISSGEMIREIYKVFENGEKQSIVLRLVPKELGSIKVMLDTVDNVLTAKVEVQNESVGHVIRNNVEQLKQSLLQSGVHVNSINISYHNSEQKHHGFSNQKRKNPEYLTENDFEEVDESILSKKMGYNTYEYLA